MFGKKKNGWNKTSDGYKFYKDGNCEEEYRIKKVADGHFHIFREDSESESNMGRDFSTKSEAEIWLNRKVRDNEDDTEFEEDDE